MQVTRQNRTINRANLELAELEKELADTKSFRAQVFSGYTHMLDVRTHDAAFHPKGTQRALDFNGGRGVGVGRNAPGPTSRLLAPVNISGGGQTVQNVARTALDVFIGPN